MSDWSDVDTTDLVYGIREELGIIVMPRSKAAELACIVSAVEGSKTWGELRARLPEGEWEDILEHVGIDTEVAPADEAAFSPDDLWGWADGDYPDWPAQRALDWMPADIVESFGREADSTLNGEFLVIDAVHEAALVEAFQARGARIEADPGLVLRAARYLEPDEVSD